MAKIRKQDPPVSTNAQTDVSLERDEAYARAKRGALALLRRGFPLGGIHSTPRDELHERRPSDTPSNPK
jgi:hypothetical protein